MLNKWSVVNELIRGIDTDMQLDTFHGNLKCLSYAPNIGYRIWIFRYKKLLVSLCDMGNGYYSFYSCVTYFDLLIAKAECLLDRLFPKRWEVGKNG